MPYRDFAFEYPPAALLIMLPPGLVAGKNLDPQAYLWAFVLQNIVLAGAITLLLARWYGVRAAMLFNGLLALSAVYMPLRFDLLPALLTLMAVRWTFDRPARAGVALAIGVLVKLYPIVLLPILLLANLLSGRPRAAIVLGAAFILAMLAISLPIEIASGGHMLDFLKFHSARGIQIESLAGGLLLVASKLHLTTVHEETSFFSSNLVCPWSAAVLKTLGPLMMAAMASLAIVLWRRWRRAAPSEQDLLLAAATTLGIFICCNRVFSPQYLVWVIPLLAAARVRWPWLLAIVCAMTAVIFPFQYAKLTRLHGVPILLLNVRNALVLAMVIYGLATRPRKRIAPV